MPKICFRDDGKVKTIYLSQEEREKINQLKKEHNFRTLKEAYQYYKQNISSPSERIIELEKQIIKLKEENEELKKKLERKTIDRPKKKDTHLNSFL